MKQDTELLFEIQRNNRKWFGDGNSAFFGDLNYYAFTSNSGTNYLVRLTNAWTDMFDGEKKPHYRLNPIGDNHRIESLTDDVFETMPEVMDWLVAN